MRRPSAALVVATAALVMSTIGTSVAATHYVISSPKQIKPGTITLNELTGSAQIVVSQTYRPFEVYVVLLVVYAALTYLVSLAIALLHRRLNRDMMEAVT